MAERRSRRIARPLAAALAALALAGCSATHVGEDWQCPLAQGKVCASVAAADPAVPETLAPETRGAANFAHDVPPYRRSGGRIAADSPAGTADEPACETDCDPFAWLGSLFAVIADAGSADAGTAVSPRNSHVETAASAPGAAHYPATAAGQSGSITSEAEPTAVAPAVPGDAPPLTATESGTEDAPGPAFDDALRTGEVVARIWIAPFVDEDGIYREGAWVRTVIAPAAWRLP